MRRATAGELVISVKVKPSKDGSSEKEMLVAVKAKIPEIDLAPAVFFSDSAGDLHRADPSQQEMFADAAERAAGRA